MNEKQFDLFQGAIQWVADEQKFHRGETDERVSNVQHQQTLWAQGPTTGEDVEATNRYGTQQRATVVCPTSACVAGNICVLNGDKFVIDGTAPSGFVRSVDHVVDDEGQMHTIKRRAIDLVGITDGEAQLLFNGDNTRTAVIKRAQLVAERHGRTLNLI